MELFLLALLGCLTGIFTGLIPGIHINTVSFSLIYLTKDPHFIYFIVPMSVTHTFIDFIPSIFLGVPEEENFLSVLPGHKMLLEGKGLNAIKITVFGGLFGGIISVLFSFVFISLIQKIKEIFPLIIPAVILTSLILLLQEEKNKKNALLIIGSAGLLGLIVLNNFFEVKDSLFVLVTGFFAFPLLVNSIQKKTIIPEQKKEKISFGFQEIKGSLLSVLGGSIVSLIPSLGPSISAFVLSKFSKLDNKAFLALLGGINTTNLIFSFFVLMATGKGRTGSAVAIKELGGIKQTELIFLCIMIFFALIFASIACIILSEILINKIQKINYKKMNLTALIFLVILVFYFSGINGLITAGIACIIGLTAIKKNIKKSACMSFLMFPVFGNYL